MSSPSLSVKERIKELRKKHALQWLQQMGFQGVYEHNAVDFIAHQLGFSRAYVAAVLNGSRNFGMHTALHLRRMLPTGRASNEFDYRVFSQKVAEVICVSAEALASEQDPEDVEELNSKVLPSLSAGAVPGVDEEGRQRVYIVLFDGKVLAVTLPKGATLDAPPFVDTGEQSQTGSINLIFAKTE